MDGRAMPELMDSLPNFCGADAQVEEVTKGRQAVYLPETNLRLDRLAHLPGQVGLVEHVLAALAGLRIDNCRIELDAPEPPGLDDLTPGLAALSHFLTHIP